MGWSAGTADRALDAIERLAASGLPAQHVLEAVAPRIDRVVPSDGSFLAATDPETTLCMGAGIVRDLPAELCQPTWDYEFLVPDYLKFQDIARSARPVADLDDATGGRPERSPRWREYSAATGFRHELRAAFTVGHAAWGIGQFDRLADAPPFSEDEQAWLARVARILGPALRRALIAEPALSAADRGPGVLVLDAAGVVLSATQEALDWLDEVDALMAPAGELDIPCELHAYAARVRASPGAAPRARLRTRTGVWLLMHASPLQGTDHLAVIVEPAKASDVAPLIVRAYELTERELEVTRAIARGLGTAEIAARLFLSPHTVRDHLKAVFEKVGVSSRGELVAKVFADHYGPPPHLQQRGGAEVAPGSVVPPLQPAAGATGGRR